MKVAVIGAGVVGLSASAELLNLGVDVTCYDKGDPMSERSSGASRIFRVTHPTPELVRLAQLARTGFGRWEEEAGAALIDASECVISGGEMHTWASAMQDAGAYFSIVGQDSNRLRLPSRALPSELLIDHAGGVIDAEMVAEYLTGVTRGVVRAEPVYALENGQHGARVWSLGGWTDFDAIIISAGSNTCYLAAQVGIYTPSALVHHVRFAFVMRQPALLQCWIDKSEDRLSTYQHMSARGEWAVGGHIDPDQTAWEIGPDKAIAASRDLVVQYVQENLDAIEPQIIGQLYCTETPGLGDGFKILRNGAVFAVYGHNLFKLAPVLGNLLARAVLEDSNSFDHTDVLS
ncbi:MAG: NAD(P)/FAD-dependent oxidoreductase [Pseudonocardiaceae bacterium]